MRGGTYKFCPHCNEITQTLVKLGKGFMKVRGILCKVRTIICTKCGKEWDTSEQVIPSSVNK
ncbi:MAG: hypothetical protein V1872_05450 [bacterium]